MSNNKRTFNEAFDEIDEEAPQTKYAKQEERPSYTELFCMLDKMRSEHVSFDGLLTPTQLLLFPQENVVEQQYAAEQQEGMGFAALSQFVMQQQLQQYIPTVPMQIPFVPTTTVTPAPVVIGNTFDCQQCQVSFKSASLSKAQLCPVCTIEAQPVRTKASNMCCTTACCTQGHQCNQTTLCRTDNRIRVCPRADCNAKLHLTCKQCGIAKSYQRLTEKKSHKCYKNL